MLGPGRRGAQAAREEVAGAGGEEDNCKSREAAPKQGQARTCPERCLPGVPLSQGRRELGTQATQSTIRGH